MTKRCSTKAADAKVDQILRDWESGAMDAAGTIEDLVELIDDLTTLEVADTRQDRGGIPGSRASTEPEGGLGPPGFDPGRKFTPGVWSDGVASAHLIAAAPELYEALEALLAVLSAAGMVENWRRSAGLPERDRRGNLTPSAHYRKGSAAADQAIAALAKARGDQ